MWCRVPEVSAYLSRAFDDDRVARMHLLQATVCQEENLVATWKLDQSGEKARGRWLSGWIFAVIFFLICTVVAGLKKKKINTRNFSKPVMPDGCGENACS